MPGGVKLIDSTLVVEIDRELAPPADALRVALMMLKVMAQNWPTSAAQRRKAARPQARTIAEGATTSAPAGGPDR